MFAEGWFDGACEPDNPAGIPTYAYVLKLPGKTVSEAGLSTTPFTAQATNNHAEYTGATRLLKAAASNGVTHLTIRGDSQLVIRQLRGEWDVKAHNIFPLYAEAVQLLTLIPHVELYWVPREQNKEADRLTHKAYAEYLQTHPEALKKVERHLAPPTLVAKLRRSGVDPGEYVGYREALRLLRRSQHNPANTTQQEVT